jgi:hypothetical protein
MRDTSSPLASFCIPFTLRFWGNLSKLAVKFFLKKNLILIKFYWTVHVNFLNVLMYLLFFGMTNFKTWRYFLYKEIFFKKLILMSM